MILNLTRESSLFDLYKVSERWGGNYKWLLKLFWASKLFKQDMQMNSLKVSLRSQLSWKVINGKNHVEICNHLKTSLHTAVATVNILIVWGIDKVEYFPLVDVPRPPVHRYNKNHWLSTLWVESCMNCALHMKHLSNDLDLIFCNNFHFIFLLKNVFWSSQNYWSFVKMFFILSFCLLKVHPSDQTW
jgi:hypothetical protein